MRALLMYSRTQQNKHTHRRRRRRSPTLSHTRTQRAQLQLIGQSRACLHLQQSTPAALARSFSLLAPTAYALSAPTATSLSLFLALCVVLLPLHSSACEVNELQRLCQCLFNERRQRTWQRLRQRQRSRSRVDPSWMSLKWRSLCKYWRGKELEERRRIEEGGTRCMFA